MPAAAAADGSVELIIGFTDAGAAQADAVNSRVGGRAIRRLRGRPRHVVQVDRARLTTAQAAYAADPRVRFVEPNSPVHATGAPSDPAASQQWALGRIGLPTAWDSATGAGVTVAVIDTGVDDTHPDLRGQVRLRANFSSAPDGRDRNGHGTHVAGAIAALANNGQGGAGVAPSARILDARALDDEGLGTYADVVEALDWAVDNGAMIANLSLVGTQPSQALADAILDAQKRGTLVVAAAGNTGGGAPTYPGAYPGVLSVAATDQDDALAASST